MISKREDIKKRFNEVFDGLIANKFTVEEIICLFKGGKFITDLELQEVWVLWAEQIETQKVKQDIVEITLSICELETFQSNEAINLDGDRIIVSYLISSSFMSLFKLLFFHKIWIQQMTFGKPFQPIHMNTVNPFFKESIFTKIKKLWSKK